MAREHKQLAVSSEDGIRLDVIVDGEKLEVRPGIVQVLRVDAICTEIGLEPGLPVSKAQMAPLVDALIEHIGVPHTAVIRRLGPKAQMRVAAELLRIFNDVLGEPAALNGGAAPVSADPTPAPPPDSSELPEGPASEFSMSSGGGTPVSAPSSEGS